MTSRVLIFGRTGQLARGLMATLPSGVTATSLGRAECDVRDASDVEAAIKATSPDVVINATAYTAVDAAESDPATCAATNTDAPYAMATAASGAGAAFVHISTDYVFDGEASQPYREDERPASLPTTVYGQTKLAGERRVREATQAHFVVRTSWVFDGQGRNFVTTMVRIGAERDEVRVVADQRGRPTYAPDLAQAVWKLCLGGAAFGTYHFANAGDTSWFALAEEMFRVRAGRGHRVPTVVPITTAEYPTPAERPRYSVLDTTKMERALGAPIRPWQTALADCLVAMERGVP